MNDIARARVDKYLDKMSIDDVDFDQYMNVEEKARVKDAVNWKERLKNYQLGEDQEGLSLPWAKANDFRMRRGESTIHTGYNGHRKSMMLGLIQLAMVAQGEKCLSISLEMAPHITLDRMVKQFVGNGTPSFPMHDVFFDFLMDKLFIYDQVGTVKWKRVIAVSRYAIQELDVTQVFLDSLMKFGILKKDLETQAQFVDELTTLGKDTGAHFHLVAHANKPSEKNEFNAPSKYDVSGSSDITNMVDNVIIHHQNKQEVREYDQLFIVEKQRNPGGENPEPRYIFHFDEKSLQFKPYKTALNMTDEDWGRCKWA